MTTVPEEAFGGADKVLRGQPAGPAARTVCPKRHPWGGVTTYPR